MRRPRATRIAWASLGLGILADLLLRVTPWGLNATVWLAVLAGAGFLLARRDGAEGPGWPLLLAAASAAGLVWRSSPVLLALFGAIWLAAISLPLLRDPWTAGVRRYALALVVTLADAALFALVVVSDLVRGRRAVEAGRLRSHAPLLRGALVAVPLLLVFGALFSAADPVFEWYVGDVFDFVLERLPSHLLMIVLSAWMACGILYGLATIVLPRAVGPGSESGRPERRGTEAIVALGLVDALFLLFLAVQVRTLFGGRELVEATLGLSYAEYAREGFFQLDAAASIALPGLLLADWFVPKDSASRSRLRGLAAALLVMMTAVLVSAALRMRLYVDAYGLTELRLYTSAFMIWLAIVIAWFGATVLWNRGERFMTGALGSFMGMALVLAALNPDATIVRVNAARIAERADGSIDEASPSAFDAQYAASLSSDAVPALLQAIPRLGRRQRCIVAEWLLAGLEREAMPDWRSWNLSRWRAREAVAAAAPRLREISRGCSMTRETRSALAPVY